MIPFSAPGPAWVQVNLGRSNRYFRQYSAFLTTFQKLPLSLSSAEEMAAQQKFNKHLWFLIVYHIIFALGSDRSITVKKHMLNKLYTFGASLTPAAVIGNGLVQIPVLHKSTLLPDLMGPDLFSFFDILLQFGILQHSNPRVCRGMVYP